MIDEQRLQEDYEYLNSFSFFALYLMETVTKEQDKKDITFQFNPYLNFTPSQIEKVETYKNQRTYTLNYYNFFGANGFLPDYLSEDFVQNKNKTLYEFLNIFYNRIMHLVCEFDAKRRIFSNQQKYFRMIQSFIGTAVDYYGFEYYYANIFLQYNRSSRGLKLILKHALEADVEIKEFTGATLPVDRENAAALGRREFLTKNKLLPRNSSFPELGLEIYVFVKNVKEYARVQETIDHIQIVPMVQKYLSFRKFRIFAIIRYFDQHILNQDKVILGRNSLLGYPQTEEYQTQGVARFRVY